MLIYRSNTVILYKEALGPSHISSRRALRLGRAVGLMDVRQRTRLSTWSVIFIRWMSSTHVVPGAGTTRVGALVALELVDENTVVSTESHMVSSEQRGDHMSRRTCCRWGTSTRCHYRERWSGSWSGGCSANHQRYLPMCKHHRGRRTGSPEESRGSGSLVPTKINENSRGSS
jgi:hypothetical protein